ncbi:hypothetical protein ACQ1Q5_09565 [Ornithobacterium rhinotracheale]
MKTTKFLLIAFIAVFSTIMMTSCNNDDDSNKEFLPNETSIGANTFGCLIDGKLFSPRSSGGYLNYKHGLTFNLGFPNYSNNDFKTIIFQVHSGERYLHFKVMNPELKVGEKIPFYDNKILEFKSYIWYTDSSIKTPLENVGNDNGYFDNLISGSCTITKIDYPIISGVFEATLSNYKGDKIKIEKGRFDINAETINKEKFD